MWRYVYDLRGAMCITCEMFGGMCMICVELCASLVKCVEVCVRFVEYMRYIYVTICGVWTQQDCAHKTCVSEFS